MDEDQLMWSEIRSRIVDARKKAGFKQNAVAKPLGLEQSNLSAMEHGKTKLSTEVLIKACKLYNVSADWILWGKEMRETNSYLEELLNLAIIYDDILYKLDKLETIEQVEEVRQYLNSLLMPE